MTKNNLPPWFLEAVVTGSVGGGPIPDWFPKPTVTNEVKPMTDKLNVFTGGKSKTDPKVFTPVDGATETTEIDKTNEPVIPDINETNFTGMPGVSKGVAYKSSQVKNWSYYYEPLAEGNLRGNSRVWGDASPEVVNYVRQMLIEEVKSNGLETEDIAMVLAIAHIESGFNPDAAAGPSSASGVGQFINATGRRYGINNSNRWDVNEQVRALVEHYIDNKKIVESKGFGMEYIYAIHHDGGTHNKYGGLTLSKQRVMPLYRKYLKALS